ncbi:MAG: protein-glutamate O-methyltransferase CheR [Halieaceae bacterium]
MVAEYPNISDEELPHWESWIENATGIVLRGRKQVLEQGIYPRLVACGVSSLDEYRRLIDVGQGGSLEKAALIDQLTVKDTRFFRNEPALGAVGEYLLRRSREVDRESHELAIWSVGCARGQEAYSLGMVASEFFDYTDVKWRVLGTDISPTALMHAERGFYGEAMVRGISSQRMARFFKSVDEGWQVEQGLRDHVRFGASNLRHIESCPYTDQDVIFCQNVLIYFREETVNRIVDQFVERLRPGGLLVLGAGEAPDWNSSRVVRWLPGRLNAYRVC